MSINISDQIGPLLSSHLVWGDAFEKDDVTVIPASIVRGGGGGGEGEQPSDEPETHGSTATGSGGGLGVSCHPAGALVLSGGKVRWLPAINANRMVLGGQLVAVTALLVLREVVKQRGAVLAARARSR